MFKTRFKGLSLIFGMLVFVFALADMWVLAAVCLVLMWSSIYREDKRLFKFANENREAALRDKHLRRYVQVVDDIK